MMNIETMSLHIRDARLQLSMIETEVKTSDTAKAINRINMMISRMEALRYAIFSMQGAKA